MSFADLADHFDEGLRLPIRGKVYAVASPDAETGLFINGVYAVARARRAGVEPDESDLRRLDLDDDDERSLYERVLGPVLDEMRADRCSWHEIEHVGQTVLVWVAVGREAAEAFWHRPTSPDGPGKAPARPQDRNPPKKKAASRGGSTTRPGSRASSSRGTGSSPGGDSSLPTSTTSTASTSPTSS